MTLTRLQESSEGTKRTFDMVSEAVKQLRDGESFGDGLVQSSVLGVEQAGEELLFETLSSVQHQSWHILL